MSVSYRDIEAAFEGTGLVVRGGFKGEHDEGLGGVTVVLVGNVGPGMWSHFSAARPDCVDPLDTWTKSVVAPRADRFAASVAYPNDKPYRPFQQWAMRAEPVTPSPLGILIHPEFGLWHAYRAALMFDGRIVGLPTVQAAVSACESCIEKPCLNTCPVGAFDGKSYNVPVCVTHMKSSDGRPCHEHGCLARLACPVATKHRTTEAQRAFHAAAFFRSNG